LVKLKFLAKKRKKSVLSKLLNFFPNSPYRACLIGGVVRDLFLDKPPVDIDLIVEDDIDVVAGALNRSLKGNCRVYPEFGTATIRTGNEQVDLARTRTEIYPAPAGLPVVKFSDLGSDFARRDFTVNAVAISLAGKNLGAILDPYSGRRDIADKIIRVLHDRSFIDDPTRIFRAIRYKHRLGFRFDRTTERLMKNAIRGKMIDRLSCKRVLSELRLIFAEDDPRPIVRDLVRYSIYRLTERDRTQLDRFGRRQLYFFLSRIGADQFPLTRAEKKLIRDISDLPAIIRRLGRATRNHDIYESLISRTPSLLELIPTIAPALLTQITLFRRLKKNRPIVTGRDLLRAGIKPGPRYRDMLRKAYYLQLDKKFRDKRRILAVLKNG